LIGAAPGGGKAMNGGPEPLTMKEDARARKRAIDRWESEGGKVLPTTAPKDYSPKTRLAPEGGATEEGIINMDLRRIEQLFDSLDHSPFREKDLDRDAEEYIVESIKELPAKADCKIVIYLEQPIELATEGSGITEAIHIHFARRAQVARQNLRQLLRRGSISLAIGLSFLVTFFMLGQLVRNILGEGQWAYLLRESLMIGGWVAMWKPLEIFLYDWWPIVGERRLFMRLSRIEVQIIQQNSTPAS
jgi:hypothetical protein